MTALQGLRVVEWGDLISAAYCTKLLQEFGAAVDKLEPATGDSARAHGPFPGDVPDPEASGIFVYLNSGKRSIVCDPSTPGGMQLLEELLERADVFVSNQPLALRRHLRLDPATLRARYPGLVVVSLTPFGDTGPNAEAPAQAIDAYAVSGTAWVIGEPGRQPLIVPLLQADYQCGAHGAAATLMALIAQRRHRLRHGPQATGGDSPRIAAAPGETVDIASADVFAAAAGTNAQIYLFSGLQKWARSGRRAFASGGPYPYVILPCKDGAVCLIGRARQEWARFVQAMGEPPWTREPRYQDLQAMGRDYPDEVDGLIMPWLAQRTRAELLELAAQFGFPLGPLRHMSEVAASPQFEHRGYFRRMPIGESRSVEVPGVPWKVAGREPARMLPAPRLGEHTRQVRQELGLCSPENMHEQ